MINVFEDINNGNYKKIAKIKETSLGSKFEMLNQFGDASGSFSYGQVVDLQSLPKVDPMGTEGDILIDHVSIITPNGDVVVPDLTLTVGSVSFFLYYHLISYIVILYLISYIAIPKTFVVFTTLTLMLLPSTHYQPANLRCFIR